MTRGKFIVFEGTEGAGKSTQIRLLADWLRSQGIQVVQTREPGGTPMAEHLRGMFKQRWDEAVDPVTEAMLLWAARRQHVTQVIRPALERGEWVLCDRFLASTFAYQVHGRQLPQGVVIDPYVMPVLEDLWPDRTLILDVPPEVSRTRVSVRGEAIDRIEQEEQAFFQRVRDGYLAYLEYDPQAQAIPASGSVEKVERAIRYAIAPLVRQALVPAHKQELGPSL